jgi:hypothetical protein
VYPFFCLLYVPEGPQQPSKKILGFAEITTISTVLASLSSKKRSNMLTHWQQTGLNPNHQLRTAGITLAVRLHFKKDM